MTGLRIIGGAWRGRVLAAPAGSITRPTSARVRQALFDILLHARWADRAVEDRAVLDVFAGSGALGLEALSRGAASATFMELDRAVCATIRRNIASCKAEDRARLIAADARTPPQGAAHDLILLDPPYGHDLIQGTVITLGKAGWIAPNALIAAEFGRADPIPIDIDLLEERCHGAAKIIVWKLAGRF